MGPPSRKGVLCSDCSWEDVNQEAPRKGRDLKYMTPTRGAMMLPDLFGEQSRERMGGGRSRLGHTPGTCWIPTGHPFGHCYLSSEADLSLLGWSGSSLCRVRNKVRGSPRRV